MIDITRWRSSIANSPFHPLNSNKTYVRNARRTKRFVLLFSSVVAVGCCCCCETRAILNILKFSVGPTENYGHGGLWDEGNFAIELNMDTVKNFTETLRKYRQRPKEEQTEEYIDDMRRLISRKEEEIRLQKKEQELRERWQREVTGSY